VSDLSSKKCQAPRSLRDVLRNYSEKASDVIKLRNLLTSSPNGGEPPEERRSSRPVAHGRNMKKFTYRGQAFYLTGETHAHECRDGRIVDLLEYESACPDCGSRFTALATKGNIRHRWLTRRCEDCRAPGIPIRSLRPMRRKLVAARRVAARRATKKRLGATWRKSRVSFEPQPAPLTCGASLVRPFRSGAAVVPAAIDEALAVVPAGSFAVEKLDAYKIAMSLLD
jgi:hypothetical protein